jgi:hypothetical protein
MLITIISISLGVLVGAPRIARPTPDSVGSR